MRSSANGYVLVQRLWGLGMMCKVEISSMSGRIGDVLWIMDDYGWLPSGKLVIAIENGHLVRWFTHQKYSKMVICHSYVNVYQRVWPIMIYSSKSQELDLKKIQKAPFRMDLGSFTPGKVSSFVATTDISRYGFATKKHRYFTSQNDQNLVFSLEENIRKWWQIQPDMFLSKKRGGTEFPGTQRHTVCFLPCALQRRRVRCNVRPVAIRPDAQWSNGSNGDWTVIYNSYIYIIILYYIYIYYIHILHILYIIYIYYIYILYIYMPGFDHQTTTQKWGNSC